jgi:hypothetical protein
MCARVALSWIQYHFVSLPLSKLHYTLHYRLAWNAKWVPFVTRLLGVINPTNETDILSKLQCEVSVVYSRPGAITQRWHADGPHIGKLI